MRKVCGRSGWSLAEALVNTVMEGEYPQRWVHSYLLQYMEACHRCFRDARIFSMGPDASRVGNPAEECIAYLIFARDCGFGAWGPLQVPSPQSCWGGEQGGEKNARKVCVCVCCFPSRACWVFRQVRFWRAPRCF